MASSALKADLHTSRTIVNDSHTFLLGLINIFMGSGFFVDTLQIHTNPIIAMTNIFDTNVYI
jgi:hypothetical protein